MAKKQHTRQPRRRNAPKAPTRNVPGKPYFLTEITHEPGEGYLAIHFTIEDGRLVPYSACLAATMPELETFIAQPAEALSEYWKHYPWIQVQS